MKQVEVLEHQQACCLEIGVKSQCGAQLIQSVTIHLFRVVYQLYYIHLLMLLPVRHCSIKYLLAQVFDHLCHQFLLHRVQ